MLLRRVEDMTVWGRIAVQVNVPVGMGALREVVVVQRPHDWQNKSEQGQSQEDYPDQRRRFGGEMP